MRTELGSILTATMSDTLRAERDILHTKAWILSLKDVVAPDERDDLLGGYRTLLGKFVDVEAENLVAQCADTKGEFAAWLVQFSGSAPEDHSRLKEAVKLAMEAVTVYARVYKPQDSGFERILEELCCVAISLGRFANEQAKERDVLQLLIGVCASMSTTVCYTGRHAMYLKLHLARAWRRCGETCKAREMFRWLVKAYGSQDNLDKSSVVDVEADLADLGSTIKAARLEFIMFHIHTIIQL